MTDAIAAKAQTDTGQDFLHFAQIDKTFIGQDGSAYQALKDVNLTINRGQFIALVGPSGCGKTTLLKIAADILAPSSGSLYFEGEAGGLRTGRFGMVFQSPALLQWRTITKNVLLPLQVARGGRYARAQRQLAEDLLERVDLVGVGSKFPQELSGGMQQRVAIARALVTDPDVLLMDEPFAALDALTRENLNHSLQSLHQESNKTVLFVTHNIDEAVFLADRIIVMSSSPGSIIADLNSNLPRPRTNESYSHPAFITTAKQVRELLDASKGKRSHD